MKLRTEAWILTAGLATLAGVIYVIVRALGFI